jgi:CDP-glucose 4,6-dehydratase
VVAQIQVLTRTELEPMVLNQARHEIPGQHLSAARARSVLGWRARYDLAQGLAATVPWYREFLGLG